MIIRMAKPEELDRVNEVTAMSFGFVKRDLAPFKIGMRNRYRWVVMGDDDKEMMSTLIVNDYQQTFDGNSCRMGGIGGVASLPQYRRKGCIRACFNKILADMYETGFDFSYLFPFSTAYYRQFGYENCVRSYIVSLQIASLHHFRAEGEYCLMEKTNPMTEAVRTVRSRWEQEYNMMIRFREEDYDWTKSVDPAGTMEYSYVYFAADGTPKAYTTYKPEQTPEGMCLNCSRFCFADKEGFSGLMQLFKSMAANYQLVKFELPGLPGMLHLLPEVSLGMADIRVASPGMVRVVNVRSVLQKAKYRGNGRIALQILDPQVPENNKTFALTFAGGKAVSVSETEEAPDAVMDIAAFSSMIVGSCDFEDGKNQFSGLTVCNENACFDQVFYSKKLLIQEHF